MTLYIMQTTYQKLASDRKRGGEGETPPSPHLTQLQFCHVPARPVSLIEVGESVGALTREEKEDQKVDTGFGLTLAGD